MAYGEFAKIYDELINEDIDYDKISDRIMEIAKLNNISYDNYLDIACGTGNVLLRVGKNFENIYGVDLSEDMLRESYDKLKENRIKGKILCQDMTDLSLNRKFNLITSVLDSTNYIIEEDELINYFKGVYDHLEDDGIFIFDINSYYKLSEILGNNIYTYNEDKVFYSWENVFQDDLLEMYLTFFVKQGELYERFEEEHLERAYKEEEIEEILKEIGFEIIDKADGYSEKIVDSNTERIVYSVRKSNK